MILSNFKTACNGFVLIIEVVAVEMYSASPADNVNTSLSTNDPGGIAKGFSFFAHGDRCAFVFVQAQGEAYRFITLGMGIGMCYISGQMPSNEATELSSKFPNPHVS